MSPTIRRWLYRAVPTVIAGALVSWLIGCLYSYPYPTYEPPCEMLFQHRFVVQAYEETLGIEVSESARESSIDLRWAVFYHEGHFYNATPIASEAGTAGAYSYQRGSKRKHKELEDVIFFNNAHLACGPDPDACRANGRRVIRHELLHHLVWDTQPESVWHESHDWEHWRPTIERARELALSRDAERDSFACIDTPEQGDCAAGWLGCWGELLDGGAPDSGMPDGG